MNSSCTRVVQLLLVSSVDPTPSSDVPDTTAKWGPRPETWDQGPWAYYSREATFASSRILTLSSFLGPLYDWDAREALEAPYVLGNFKLTTMRKREESRNTGPSWLRSRVENDGLTDKHRLTRNLVYNGINLLLPKHSRLLDHLRTELIAHGTYTQTSQSDMFQPTLWDQNYAKTWVRPV
jgi:hypothetical protein